MSESYDFDPGPWSGYDFNSARKAYDVHLGRSYEDAKVVKKDPGSLVPEKITTESTAPLVIVTDETGSMGKWTSTIFSKLPYLVLEGKEYLGNDMEISFAAIGDVFSDKYPLQVRNFGSGTELEKELKELVIEGNGGSNYHESYDMAMLYYSRCCFMPNAISPVMVIIGDEGLYETVDREHASNLVRINLENRLSIEELVAELKQKFSVYHIHKPYGSAYRDGDKVNSNDASIYAQWKRLLGDDHVVVLPDASRVVDVIFGILAKETGRIEYFEKELKDRQLKDDNGQAKVSVVLKSLVSLHHSVKQIGHRGQSVLKRTGNSKLSKNLLE